MKKILIYCLSSFLFISTVAYADPQSAIYNNEKALKGLTATKAYFDVTVGEPEKLLVRLQLVEKTYNQLVMAGVSPDFHNRHTGQGKQLFHQG